MHLGRWVLSALAVLALPGCEGVPFVAREGTTITITANPQTIPVNGGTSSLVATVIESGGTPVADETGRRTRRRRGAGAGRSRCSRIASSTSFVRLIP